MWTNSKKHYHFAKNHYTLKEVIKALILINCVKYVYQMEK